MGCGASKKPISTPADRQGQIKQTRKNGEQYDSRTVREDVVRQLRPTRFFNVTKTSVEATVTVDKPATIRAYLEPDGGGSDTEEIELECEADVDHHLVYEGLKPGTLYRLKLFYVVPERSTVSRLLTSMLSAERPAHASDAGGSSETAVKVRRHKPAAGSVGDTFGRRKVVRRLTAQSTMKPVWIPPRETTKNEVRTLPPDWASTESL